MSLYDNDDHEDVDDNGQSVVTILVMVMVMLQRMAMVMLQRKAMVVSRPPL